MEVRKGTLTQAKKGGVRLDGEDITQNNLQM